MANILFIDDDSQFRSMLHETLERMGHTVTSLPDGTRAGEVIARKHIDVLITDIIMPEREGLEVILSLKKSHPHLKIIAISGGGRVSSADYLRIARTFGAAQALAKPFSEQQLTDALESVLS